MFINITLRGWRTYPIHITYMLHDIITHASDQPWIIFLKFFFVNIRNARNITGKVYMSYGGVIHITTQKIVIRGALHAQNGC